MTQIIQQNPIPIQPVGHMAQFMLDCQAAARTVPGMDPNKVFIGHYEWLATQQFYQELKHDGFELFIGSSKGVADCYRLEGEFQLPADLFYTIPDDVPNNLIPIQTKISQLCVAWSSMFTQWVSGGNRNPLKIEWENPKVRRHEKPFVLSTSFILHQRFISDQASDPFFSPPVPGN